MTQKNDFSPSRMLNPMSHFHIEMDRTGDHLAAIISGANAIRDFSDELAVFRVRGFFLKISGRYLSINVYENKTVELTGKIERVEFVYDKT